MQLGIGIDRLTGFLFLFVLATSLAGVALALVPAQAPPDEVATTLRDLAADPGRQRMSSMLLLASYVAVVALAGALYLTFSPRSRPLALVGTLWRFAEGVILGYSVINTLVLLEIAEAFVSATGAEAVALEATARAIRLTDMGALAIGHTFYALGMLMYAILFVSTKAVPLPLGWLGVGASGLVLVGWLLLLTAGPDLSILFIPAILFEISIGLWLILRGAKVAA